MSKRMKMKNSEGIYVEQTVEDALVSTYEAIGWEIVEPKVETKKEKEEVKLDAKSSLNK
jgi:hypothetical protein